MKEAAEILKDCVVFADSTQGGGVCVCLCGTLEGTPNDGWQACSGNLASLKTAIISLFTHQPNLASPSLWNDFFISPSSLCTLFPHSLALTSIPPFISSLIISLPVLSVL